MRWFGKAYGAPYEADTPHADTPIGQPCARCCDLILEDDTSLLVPVAFEDRELPYHYECHLRTVIGGLNHLQGLCSCCGGSLPPDPEELSKREAAIQAVNYWHGINANNKTRG